MGVKYSVSGRDVVNSAIVVANQDMATAIAEAAGDIGISVGDNLLEIAKRHEVDRALQQIIDVFRESQWPEGPLATNYGYLLSAPAVKGQVVLGNAASSPSATLDEDSILITYNQLFNAGEGSSLNYQSAFSRIRDFIRRQLTGVGSQGVAVAATGTLTATGQPANNDTVTIDGKVYTFQTALTNVDGNVLIGATASDSLDNLISAINLGGGAGTTYAAATTLHPSVSAAAGAGDTMTATAKETGTAGNSIDTTETSVNLAWGAATLTGGK